jgi:hypothetical protein
MIGAILGISPNRIFINNENGSLVSIPIKTVVVSPAGPSTNTQVVAAASGKKILVVGGFVLSTGAATQLEFKSGSGGTLRAVYYAPANTVANPNIPLILQPGDIFETEEGVGLFVDNSAVNAVISLRYVEYIPVQ